MLQTLPRRARSWAQLRRRMSAGAISPEVLPKGSPFNTSLDSPHLSVLSYNVLAPIYVRPIDSRTGAVQAFAAFEWCGEGDGLLDFAIRCPRLLAEIQAAAADIVCLQEVQFESRSGGHDSGFGLPAWLRPLTIEGGGDYFARIPAQSDLREIAERNQRVLNCFAPVANVLLVKQGRLEMLDDEATKSATTRVGALVKGAEGSALSRNMQPTAVFSVHLDATHESQRVGTIVKCLQQARQLGTREVLVAGDMNTEILPGSCVAALITDAEQLVATDPSAADVEGQAEAEADKDDGAAGLALKPSLLDELLVQECASALRLGQERSPNAEEIHAWKELYATAAAAPQETRIALRRVPTHGTRAAYDHGQHAGPCRSWRLDHILYRCVYN